MFMALSGALSGWCNVGSGGELADNDCITGTGPLTTNCSNGAANSSGHCKTGGTVTNVGAVTYCLTGTGGSNANAPCTTGAKAVGPTGCKTGNQACHCDKGSGA
jgi:hypothetical protein